MISDLLRKLDLLFSYILIFLLPCYFYNSKVISIFGMIVLEACGSKVAYGVRGLGYEAFCD
jgi:hypothetical protein